MRQMDTTSQLMVTGNDDTWHQLISRINNFHVLCVYDRQTRQTGRNDLRRYAKEIFHGERRDMPLFHKGDVAEPFFIWEKTYQENSRLFFKLRETARHDVIFRISIKLAAYFLNEYTETIRNSIIDYPVFNNLSLLDKSIAKLECLLMNDTFLAEDETWHQFYNWFKRDVTIQVLQRMQEDIGYTKLLALSHAELNEQFRIQVMKHLQMNAVFMDAFIQNTEAYLQYWFPQLISCVDVDSVSIKDMQVFLDVTYIEQQARPLLKPPIPFALIEQDYVMVMSNMVYQSVRDALSNHEFATDAKQTYLTAHIRKRSIEGVVQLKPCEQELMENQAKTFDYREWMTSLSEWDVDIFDALCCLYLSHADDQNAIIEIDLYDLLLIRGMKTKLSGNGRRGGFEKEQIQKLLKALSLIQSLWVDFSRVIVYDERKPKEKRLLGRTFLFLDQFDRPCPVEKLVNSKTLKITVDDVFAEFLTRSGRQTALLPIRTLQYNSYYEDWEKKLARYLSWRWRTQAKKGEYKKPHKISKLLERIGKKVNKRTPSRTRDRFEQALDRLVQDQLIAGWEYEDWDESIATKKGWARLWQDTLLVIQPPQAIIDYYQSITKTPTRTKHTHEQGRQMPRNKQINLINQLNLLREKRGLTLKQIANGLNLSASYVSMIAREQKIPSQKALRQIERWLNSCEVL